MKPFSIILVCLIANQFANAEIPEMSVHVAAKESTTFSELLPVIETLQNHGVTKITYALKDSMGISVSIRLREDIKVLSTAQILQLVQEEKSTDRAFFEAEQLKLLTDTLKESGVSQVKIETIELMPSKRFTLGEFHELRQKQRPVLIICRADWNISSIKMDQDLFENTGVIRAVK